jgi:hypothetical protein
VTDAELDAALRALGPIEPPADVQARVLAAVGLPDARIAEIVGGDIPAPNVVPLPTVLPTTAPTPTLARARRRWALAGALLALAAGGTLAMRALPEPASDPASLVPRGDGDVLPRLGLRVAVRRGTVVERLTAGRAYAPGDTLLFRVSAPTPLTLTLRRDDEVIFRGPVPAGDTDLPVGYALEAGQGAARFTIEGGGATASVSLPGVSP